MRDIAHLSDLNQDEFNFILGNMVLFGAGVILNGIGWAVDVIGHTISRGRKRPKLYTSTACWKAGKEVTPEARPGISAI